MTEPLKRLDALAEMLTKKVLVGGGVACPPSVPELCVIKNRVYQPRKPEIYLTCRLGPQPSLESGISGGGVPPFLDLAPPQGIDRLLREHREVLGKLKHTNIRVALCRLRDAEPACLKQAAVLILEWCGWNQDVYLQSIKHSLEDKVLCNNCLARTGRTATNQQLRLRVLSSRSNRQYELRELLLAWLELMMQHSPGKAVRTCRLRVDFKVFGTKDRDIDTSTATLNRVPKPSKSHVKRISLIDLCALVELMDERMQPLTAIPRH